MTNVNIAADFGGRPILAGIELVKSLLGTNGEFDRDEARRRARHAGFTDALMEAAIGSLGLVPEDAGSGRMIYRRPAWSDVPKSITLADDLGRVEPVASTGERKSTTELVTTRAAMKTLGTSRYNKARSTGRLEFVRQGGKLYHRAAEVDLVGAHRRPGKSAADTAREAIAQQTRRTPGTAHASDPRAAQLRRARSGGRYGRGGE